MANQAEQFKGQDESNDLLDNQDVEGGDGNLYMRKIKSVMVKMIMRMMRGAMTRMMIKVKMKST